jgi:stringent starvation protein B
MIAAIWARFYRWIVGAAVALLTVAAIYSKGRSAGKAIEQQKATQRDLTEAKEHAATIRETSEVQAEVARLPDSDVRERLRKFTRDN